MNRKFFSGISVAGMLLFGTYALAQSPRQNPQQNPRENPPPQQQDRQRDQQQATKQVSGNVTNIGDDRRSFTLQPDTNTQNENKSAMEFQVDDKTQVRGRVTTGTMVMVEYQPGEGGKYLAVSIAPQGGGNGQ